MYGHQINNGPVRFWQLSSKNIVYGDMLRDRFGDGSFAKIDIFSNYVAENGRNQP